MGHRIIFPAKGQVGLEAFETRPPDAGEVQVRTLASLMSIGTDTTILHAKYDPGTHFAARFSFPPRKTGVQAVAEVEVVGAGVTEFQAGDRVFMRMAHTSHWTLPAAQCSPVPRDVDPKLACWCGPSPRTRPRACSRCRSRTRRRPRPRPTSTPSSTP